MADSDKGRLIYGVLACHNRKSKTLSCLRSFFCQKNQGAWRLQAVVLEDGSTDGTAEAVQKEFPQLTLLRGDGKRFWCGGMRIAWAEAAKHDPDYYLLLNDDTCLHENALAELLALAPTPDTPAIAVGAIADPTSGLWSYGGIPATDGARLTGNSPRNVKTFNANCVLIPRAVFQKLGIFHPAYTHAMGDFDYGYAARRAGISLRETTRFVGTCPRDKTGSTWQDRDLPRRERLRLLTSPKGLPYREWWTYCWRNHRAICLYRWLSPTLRILLGR